MNIDTLAVSYIYIQTLHVGKHNGDISISINTTVELDVLLIILIPA